MIYDLKQRLILIYVNIKTKSQIISIDMIYFLLYYYLQPKFRFRNSSLY